jgi:hypothetical protein
MSERSNARIVFDRVSVEYPSPRGALRVVDDVSFDIHDGHPFESRVERLLQDVRRDVGALWRDVEACKAGHPADAARKRRVYFYFGQFVEEPGPASEPGIGEETT